MRNKYWSILLIFGLLLTNCKGENKQQEIAAKNFLADSIDIEIFNSLKTIVLNMRVDTLPMENKMLEFGKFFLQTPYKASTLEGEGTEILRVNLRGMDCTTYIENIVTLSRTFSNKKGDFTSYLKELEHVRYRNGRINGYVSRLHYFTDWLHENEKKGILKNITKSLWGVPFNRKIDFMSSHPDSYIALKNDSLMVEQIKSIEDKINQRVVYYVPEKEIEQIENQILNGDIIALTTNINGLDVEHVGMAIHVNGRLHIMHASSSQNKVVISNKPLAEMAKENRSQTGIIVGRVSPKTTKKFE